MDYFLARIDMLRALTVLFLVTARVLVTRSDSRHGRR